jgi:membrane protein YqaA with SNARE-associated domain
MTGLLAALVAVGVGAGSALVPLLNAEVYAVATAGTMHPALVPLLVVALACGQTAGKVALFETARRGSARWQRHRTRPPGRWATRISAALGSRRSGNSLVLASAVLGLPPLAAVSLAAGASGQRRWEFAAFCLAGRTVRFAALALPAAWALS